MKFRNTCFSCAHMYDSEFSHPLSDNERFRKGYCPSHSEVSQKTHADLPVDVQDLLTDEQKEDIDIALERNAPFIITGPQGPTGKTTLALALRRLGAVAIEPWETTTITLSNFFTPKKGEN